MLICVRLCPTKVQGSPAKVQCAPVDHLGALSFGSASRLSATRSALKANRHAQHPTKVQVGVQYLLSASASQSCPVDAKLGDQSRGVVAQSAPDFRYRIEIR